MFVSFKTTNINFNTRSDFVWFFLHWPPQSAHLSTPVKEVGIVIKNMRTPASLISSEEVPLLVGFYTDEDRLTNATGPYVVLAGTLCTLSSRVFQKIIIYKRDESYPEQNNRYVPPQQKILAFGQV